MMSLIAYYLRKGAILGRVTAIADIGTLSRDAIGMVMAHISSHADVASKLPSNFKPKPSLFLSVAIPKFDTITHPLL